MLQLLVLQISITNVMVLQLYKWGKFPASIYLFNANSRNTTKKCEICSKLTKKLQNEVWRLLVFLLLALNIFHTFF